VEAKRALSRIIGHGEMADLIRAFDWSSTPIGPVETWSDTLITTVNLLLASRHPMFLWWGPELIQFYNDGYRPSIRDDKHPSAVGQRGTQCWPEIWPIIGPQIEAVMTRGDSTWNINQLVAINRNGKLEEVFWTYGYSPVRDKDGRVQGTLVVCTETTEQVLSERRLRSLLRISAATEPGDIGQQPLSSFVHSIARNFEDEPADTPFAAMYVLSAGDIVHFGSTNCIARLTDPKNWPLQEVALSRTALLVEDLQSRFGEVICNPWPEAVTKAYVVPVHLPNSSLQAVLVCGISPRLPFDQGYQTFFNLIATRIAALLQNEIYELERAEAAERFSRLAAANPFGMVIGDLNGGLKYVNPAFLRTLGYSEQELTSGAVRWTDLTPPEFAEADAHALQQLRETGRCEVYEKAYVAKDGRRIPILIGASTINPPTGGTEIAAFVTDLTPLKFAQEELRKANNDLEEKVRQRTADLEAEVAERKRAEINLRELTGRLLLVQDEERRRMARELHDNAGQTLTALGMNLSALLAMAEAHDAKITTLATQSLQLSDELSKEIRTLSYLLHPPLLDEVGLASALRWYVEGFSERSKIEVELDLPEELGRLPDELELVLFRVVQESLTNIHRHSGSSRATIRLARLPAAVTVEISDRGQGIPPDRLRDLRAAKAGVGVRGMQERVRQFGGTLEITSTKVGATVAVSLPHEQAARTAS
jgi:PAS domain S-box-containing protein